MNQIKMITQSLRLPEDTQFQKITDFLSADNINGRKEKFTRRLREIHKAKQILKISVLSNLATNTLGDFLYTLVKTPIATKQLYWPAMPHDTLFEAIQLMKRDFGNTKTRLWLCPNGHLYQVGDCGAFNETRRCRDCGQQIGRGQQSPQSAENRRETTPVGFVEVTTTQKSDAIRSLSKLESELMKVILNIAMLIAYEDHENDVRVLLAGKDDSYLTNSIDFSLGVISSQIGKSQDSVLVLICHILNGLSNLPKFDQFLTSHSN